MIIWRTSYDYARVNCRRHGPVGISEIEYARQIRQVNRTWLCPCGDDATFDDEYFEAVHDGEES